MATYLEQIKQNNPDAYNKIANLAQYTANENFGGNIQDYQAQLLTPINTKEAGIPQQLEFTQPPSTQQWGEDGYYTYTPPPQIKTPGGFEEKTLENDVIDGYRSKTPINVNGVPVFAEYDTSGKLTGYQGDPRVVTWLDGGRYVRGNWDAQGNPSPITIKTHGGGFFDSSDLGVLAGLALSYFGAPIVADALGIGGAVSAESSFLSGMAEENAISGAGVAGASGGSYGAGAAAGAANAVPLVNPTNITPLSQVGTDPYSVNANYAPPTAPGGEGLVGGNTANIADMGGGQGITSALPTGTVLGATGGVLPTSTLGAGIGTGLAAGTGSLLGTGAAAGGAAAAAATKLTDLITPSTALIGKAILDTVGSNKTVAGINSAAATQQAAYEQSKKDLAGLYANQQSYQRPYMATGTNALSNLGALGTGTYQMYDEQGNPTGTGTGSGYLQHQFDASDLAKGLAPNYDFMLQQGQMANQRAANMAGGGFGGNALQGLNRYTQDYAGNAYQNAFTNYQNQRQNIFGNLSNLAGIGQGATKDLTAATGAYGTNLTNLNVGNAAAQAAAQVAAAQQSGTNLSNLGNTAVVASLLGQNPGIAKTPVA
jgi:hypothetical protein